jgi:mannobiose 2-epimerase
MKDLLTRCDAYLDEVQNHLRDELLPFWLNHGVDEEYGGFLTYFDGQGEPTGETEKTLVCQTRMIYAFSAAHRAGLGQGAFLDLARGGVDFLLEHFWDEDHCGWVWTCEQDGRPLNQSKITYGQSFAIYALSEYLMASGDYRAMEWVVNTYESMQTLGADNGNGGYYEFMDRDWQPKGPGVYGGDRKSFDVHMHLMEAFTSLYEATGMPIYARRASEMLDLVHDAILHPEFRTGQAAFLLDWTPVRQILFKDVWGADRDAEDDAGRPFNNTSYGHNVEFAWLSRHTCDILGVDVAPYRDALRELYDHACEYGVDRKGGGIFCEGPHDGPAAERNKEFWQQAEAMVGFLDAYLVFGDEKYLDAYGHVHRFVMDHVINHEVGEWYPLFDSQNKRLWDYMGHAWKINYHTVRAMIQCEQRLLKITS